MSLDETIRAYFVTTINVGGGNSNSRISEAAADFFANALSVLREHLPEGNIRQIKASEGFPLISSGSLTKKDVFIFDRFEGDFFEQLQQTKSLIVGAPCIVACILVNKPIPLGTSPVYTAAMRDLQITATNITPAEKERIRVFIQWMGGHYFQNLGRSITHLISNTIKSNKYEHATLNGIPVMHIDWVQKVWERSSEEICLATNVEFDKYHLPTFFGANITSTGLDNDKKNRIMRLVNENGGTYHRAFRSHQIDIVITEQDKTNSDKYKAALRFNKDVLLPEWIFDSVEKGYALPTKNYMVKASKQVSTPAKTSAASAVGDQTQLSELSRINYVPDAARMLNDITSVDETRLSSALNMSTASTASNSGARREKDLLKRATTSSAMATAISGTHYRVIFEAISATQAKKAGMFLDGCSIYLSGFLNDELEKLKRILNVGGATRFDEPTTELTHIIVGQLNDVEYRNWQKLGLNKSVHIVRLDWLLESIKAGHIVSETNYILCYISISNRDGPDLPSPSSKRTLRSMNQSFKQPGRPVKKKLFTAKETTKTTTVSEESIVQAMPMANSTEMALDGDEQHLLAQYSKENIEGVPVASMPVPVPKSKPASALSPKIPPLATSTQMNTEQIAVVAPAPPSTAAAMSASVLTAAAVEQPSIVTYFSSIDFEKLNYFQGASVYVDEGQFTQEFYMQIVNECELAKGNIVLQTFCDPVDYAIVSFEHTLNAAHLPIKARHIVTELYVESCMRENKLVPIEYYHKHIPHTADSKPLTAMVIVLSIYTGLERDFIDSLARLLGATLNKTYMKKEKPLLVCSRADGSKYEGAIKWGYPIVNAQWLVDCAEQGKKLAYTNYLVGDSAADFPISPAMDKTKLNGTVKKNKPRTTNAMDLAMIDNGVVQEFTPLRNKRVSELAICRESRNSPSPSYSPDVIAANPIQVAASTSPKTPVFNSIGCATYNFDFMESILNDLPNEEERQCVREIIEEMRQNQTPELERIRRQACTPINGKVHTTPKGIPDFCLTPEYEKRIADNFERRWHIHTKRIKPSTPLDEIRRRIMRITCESLGIPYNIDSPEVTVDHGSNNNRNGNSNNSPSSSSRGKKQKVGNVNVDDHNDDDGNQNENENDVNKSKRKTPRENQNIPMSHNASADKTLLTSIQHKSSPKPVRTLFDDSPKISTDAAASMAHNSPSSHNNSGSISDPYVPNTQSPDNDGMPARTLLLGKSTINFDKISFEETDVDASTPTAAATADTTSAAPAAADATVDAANATVDAADATVDAADATVDAAATRSASETSTIRANRRRSHVNSPELKQLADYLKECESKRDCAKEVHCDNDDDFRGDVHYLQQLESEPFCSERMVDWYDPSEANARRKICQMPPMQYQGTPHFSISCSDAIRNDIVEKILKLGGKVCKNQNNYDPQCTHFVCERPNRGEKMLGSIASGKWVLSIKYIEECYAKDQFIDEELSQWGNARALNLPELTADEKIIAAAAYRWHTELSQTANEPGGAFTGFKVVLHIAERNANAIKTVLRAGNAEIIEAKIPYGTHNKAHTATHCFVDMKKLPISTNDYKFLNEHGVNVMSQMYINAYLMNGRDVDQYRYYIRM